jgi:hypothetical protein
MAHAAFGTLLRYLRRLHNAAAETSDGDLLRDYAVNRDAEQASAPAAMLVAATERMATLIALGQAAGSAAVSPSVATLTQSALQAMTVPREFKSSNGKNHVLLLG